jgi:uncharacterized integral membrane protein
MIDDRKSTAGLSCPMNTRPVSVAPIGAQGRSRYFMARTKIVVALIAVALVLILGLQNTAGVDAKILFYSGTVPLAALLLLSFVAGVVAGLLIALAFGGRRKATASDT